jgi:hypothetical protein
MLGTHYILVTHQLKFLIPFNIFETGFR